MKAYTDLEQSKKLAEILPPESADMCHKCIGDESYDTIVRPYSEYFEKYRLLLISKDFNAIPCWSLIALLKVIPKRIKDFNVLRIDIGEEDFAIWYDEIGFGVNSGLPDITLESPVDACYEMIIKLHEQKLL